MLKILSITGPIYLIIAAGFLSVRGGLFEPPELVARRTASTGSARTDGGEQTGPFDTSERPESGKTLGKQIHSPQRRRDAEVRGAFAASLCANSASSASLR